MIKGLRNLFLCSNGQKISIKDHVPDFDIGY